MSLTGILKLPLPTYHVLWGFMGAIAGMAAMGATAAMGAVAGMAVTAGMVFLFSAP